MKNKNCKGITLLSLAITIVVLIILASISINYGQDILEQSALESVETNMLLIKAKVKVYAEEYNFSGDAGKLYGTKVSESTESIVTEYNASVGNIYANYYYLSANDLSNMGLAINNGNYLVNYDYNNIDIVYIEGITVNGTTYHTMSEIESIQ